MKIDSILSEFHQDSGSSWNFFHQTPPAGNVQPCERRRHDPDLADLVPRTEVLESRPLPNKPWAGEDQAKEEVPQRQHHQLQEHHRRDLYRGHFPATPPALPSSPKTVERGLPQPPRAGYLRFLLRCTKTPILGHCHILPWSFLVIQRLPDLQENRSS